MTITTDELTSDVDYTTPAVLPTDRDEAFERVRWHARMAAALEAKRERLADMYDDERRRLSERRQVRLGTVMAAKAWHEAPIESYHRMLIAINPNADKTLDLAVGDSKVREPEKAVAEIEDAVALKAWLLTNRPDLFDLPNITTIRSAVKVVDGKVLAKKTGEIVPGMEAVVPPSTWNFKPARTTTDFLDF
jgi:hypothetical protein